MLTWWRCVWNSALLISLFSYFFLLPPCCSPRPSVLSFATSSHSLHRPPAVSSTPSLHYNFPASLTASVEHVSPVSCVQSVHKYSALQIGAVFVLVWCNSSLMRLWDLAHLLVRSTPGSMIGMAGQTLLGCWSMKPLKVYACVSLCVCVCVGSEHMCTCFYAFVPVVRAWPWPPRHAVHNIKEHQVYLNSASAVRGGMLINYIWMDLVSR